MTTQCPKCETGILIQRRGGYGNFYGCSNYPKCKHTAKYLPKPKSEMPEYRPIDLSTVNLSRYQSAILDRAINTADNLIVRATAGSGKSFTLRLIAQSIPASTKAMYATFDKRSTVDIAGKLPPHITVSTWHSYGFRAVKARYPKSRLDEKKMTNILSRIKTEYKDAGQENFVIAIDNYFGEILKIVSLAKSVLAMDWGDLADSFGIGFNGAFSLLAPIFDRMMSESLVMSQSIIDFDDMVYLPAAGHVPCNEVYDLILCDESQDLNLAQNNLAQKAGKRAIIVGDENQAIYLFRGADAESMNRLRSHFRAVELPLSISYRNPQSIIDYINARFPDIQHESAPGAIPGSIEEIEKVKFVFAAQPGDMILCRVNAPLARYAFEFIRNGKPARILGRDIGEGLISLLSRMAKRAQSNDLSEVLSALDDYTQAESARLYRKGKENAAIYLEDQRLTIQVIAEDAENLQGLIGKIAGLFTDETSGIILSTVHKAKGAEAETVYIVEPQLFPLPKGNEREEANIEFVALSRTKDKLYFVI